jgi:UDP-N-acetylglucosamine:LPS N-acetylglucosamine transferase
LKNIVIVSDTFVPDKTSGAKLLEDLALELSKKNNVLVLSAQSSNFFKFFNKQKIFYQKNKKKIKIIRINCPYIKSNYFILRGIGEFLMDYIIYYKSQKIIDIFKPTSLIIYSPSIFFSFLFKKIKMKFSVKTLCILRDIFPHWAIDVNKIKNFFVKKILMKIFKKFIEKFDNVGVESKTNLIYLNKNYKNNFFYLPSWVNLEKFNYKRNVVKKKANFLFAGNFGGGQDLNKVLFFFSKLDKNLVNKFYLLGNGISVNIINNFIKNNKNNKLIFLKKKTQNEYIKFLNIIDYGIVSLDERIRTVNFPGRLFSYLNNNVPVVLLSKKKDELSDFIIKNQLGVKINPFQDFHVNLLRLTHIKNKFNSNQKFCFKFLNKNFSVNKISKKIIEKI